MKLIRRCVFCESIWVHWNMKLEMTEEPVYAHDCYGCGRIHLTDHRVPNGMPRLFPAIARKVLMRQRDRSDMARWCVPRDESLGTR